MVKEGEPVQECIMEKKRGGGREREREYIMELINATGTWVFDSHGTISLEQVRESYPSTFIFLWSKVPAGQGVTPCTLGCVHECQRVLFGDALHSWI